MQTLYTVDEVLTSLYKYNSLNPDKDILFA